MAAKPLTKAEKLWLKKLQEVFNECPSSRLGAYTIGDPDLSIYDRSMESEIYQHMDNCKTGEFGNAVVALGAELGVINTPFQVHSVAG